MKRKKREFRENTRWMVEGLKIIMDNGRKRRVEDGKKKKEGGWKRDNIGIK